MNELDHLTQQLKAGQISRREFMGRATALGVSAATATSLLPTEAIAQTPKRGGSAKFGLHLGSTLNSADPATFADLQQDVDAHAKALHDWLTAQRSAGRRVLGYGAASRAVALLCQAHVDRKLLPAVVDASPAKQGLRMPNGAMA